MRTSRTLSSLLCLSFLAACGGGSSQAPAAESAHDEAVADENVRVLDFEDDLVAHGATDQAAPPAGGEARSAGTIRAIVRSHLAAFGHCYEQLLATVPSAEGRVLMRMTIAADGIIGDAEVVQSTIPSMPPEMTTCMVEAARTMHFAAHPEATVVNYPFVFSAGGAPVAAPPPSTATAAPPPSTAATTPPATTARHGHH